MPKFTFKKIDIALVSVMFIASVLRLINLGYSDYQGDEIKALLLPEEGQSTVDFLFNQRKGPLQFLVTWLVHYIDPNYENQFLVRIVFAVSGILAVYFFYLLVKLHFGKRIAAYASFLLATNGFFVAFARIAQYQSLVIFFGILALYLISIALNSERFYKKGLVFSAGSLAFSVLAHYDGLFFGIPYAFLFFKWLENKTVPQKAKVQTFVYSALLFLILTLSFYGPFAFYVSQNTKDYWIGRLTGDVSDKVSSSYYLFTVYQPIYVIHFYIAFATLGLLAYTLLMFNHLSRNLLSKYKFYHQVTNVSSFIPSSVLLMWFAIPLLIWEMFVHIPGTHIYTYLVPGFILVAMGIVYAENIWDKLSSYLIFIKPVLIKNIMIASFLVFVTLQSYAIFVDNIKEYPWESEKFLFWTLSTPTPAYHLSLFGFPYYRDWENIGRYVNRYPEVTHYSTNERESIVRHFVHKAKDTDLAGFYIYIRNPQSFTNEITSEKVLYWASKYPPVYTLSRDGVDLVSIYLMQPGTLPQLQLMGK
jgi:4-amino-4-deoxy-L-arabinose transferase-like glycosyltransferase